MYNKITHSLEDIFREKSIFDKKRISDYTQNLSGMKKEILGVVYPKSLNEIQRLIELANRHRIPLYPISTGKNWGLGGKLPVKDDCLVVDLSQMNKIHAVNKKHGYAIIEAGVTQVQLYEYLEKHALPYVFNVTGSGLDTSIVGNALDRGIGYFSSRVDDIMDLEVMLGNGKLLKTGFGHYKDTLVNHLYPFGIGADLRGLFFQSNFGIVIKAGFRLLPRKQIHATIICGLELTEKFPDFIDDLRELFKKGFLQNVTHIASRTRSKVSFIPNLVEILEQSIEMQRGEAVDFATKLFEKRMNNAWSAFGGLMGTKRQVKMCYKQIKKKMSRYGKVSFITQEKVSSLKKISQSLNVLPFFNERNLLLQCLDPITLLCQGIPSDISLKSIYWPQKEEPKEEHLPEQSNSGLLFSLPILPMDGKLVQRGVALIEHTFSSFGFEAYITLNVLGGKSLEGVINLSFDRRDTKKLTAANEAIRTLNKKLMESGFTLFRVSINNMDQVIDENDPFWQTISKIKSVFDPNNIIAPKRYNLL